jgi:hypothetical protein
MAIKESGPQFTGVKGGVCQVQRCVDDATYEAKWKNVTTRVCTTHKQEVEKKPWPDVAAMFGSKPPGR